MKKESFPMWVYHKTKEAKIIDSADFDKLKAAGWKDAPVKK
jgi:hypothetical protein